jgi:hypothetical protein
MVPFLDTAASALRTKSLAALPFRTGTTLIGIAIELIYLLLELDKVTEQIELELKCNFYSTSFQFL